MKSFNCRIIIKLFVFLLLCLLCDANIFCKSAGAEDDWALTLYGARLSANSFGETLTFQSEYENSYILALAVSKKVLSFRESLDIELEGQVVKHFKEQNHWEFNVLSVFRWLPFFWDIYIDTSLAIGVGLSYATKNPPIELTYLGPSPKLMGYLMVEFAFCLPDVPKYSFVVRIHHRSGANGLFGNRHDASNAFGFGIKYLF